MSEEQCCAPGCCAPEPRQEAESQANDDAVRQHVRDSYAKLAQASDAGSGCGVETGCCGVSEDSGINALISTRLGYSDQDVASVPEGADLGLGCGNPRAIASLKPGEVVVDLGSGAGFDCFLAAQEVGDTGRVIGVDMTPEMVSKARINAATGKYDNVEFRLGEIEHLPVADNAADAIISNCVINLSPNKPRVFAEAFRILKPGGRVSVSDVVATAQLPEAAMRDLTLYSACVAGASLVDELEVMMAAAGFQNIRISPKDESAEFIKDWVPGRGVESYVVSATIEADKP